jgi:hypothetical protein
MKKVSIYLTTFSRSDDESDGGVALVRLALQNHSSSKAQELLDKLR